MGRMGDDFQLGQLSVLREKELFLSVYVDDVVLFGKKHAH